MHKSYLFVGGVAASGLLWSQAPLPAQTNVAPQHVAALEKRILDLEQRLERLDAVQTNTTPYVMKDGFALASADKTFALKLRGFVQADGRYYPGDERAPATDSFLLRRARLIFDGTLSQNFDFRIAPDFGGGKTELQDAYLDYKPSPYANLRFGRAKTPIGIERLQSSTDTFFTELGVPSALTPNYDIGIHLYGSAGKGVLTYTLGLVNGAPDGASGDSDTNDGSDLVGRVFVTPFRNTDIPLLSGFSFGLAGSIGDQKGSATAAGLPAYKTSGQKTYFSYTAGTYADGRSTHLSPQLYYSAGPVGLLAEYVVSEQEVTGIAVTTTHLRNDAWGLTASCVLTGESPSLKGVQPSSPFNPAAGQWGAVELVARLGRLSVDKDAFAGGYADPTKSARAARNIGFGLNWYLTRNVKLMVDYEETTFTGGAVDGDRPTEKFVSTRAQLGF